MIFGTAYLYEKMSQFIEQNKYVLLLIYEMLTLISSMIKSCKRSHNVRGFTILYIASFYRTMAHRRQS